MKLIFIKMEKLGVEKVLSEIGNIDGIIVPIGWGVRGAEGMSPSKKEKNDTGVRAFVPA